MGRLWCVPVSACVWKQKIGKRRQKKKHKMALGKSRAEKEVGKQIPRRRKRREMVLFGKSFTLKKKA